MGTRTSVIDVAQDMQLVDGESLYHVAYSTNEIISLPGRYDTVDNHSHIGSFVLVVGTFVQ